MSAYPQSTPTVQPPHIPGTKKRIIICCDGTGNSFVSPNYIPGEKGSGENSNVVKFYTALEIGNTSSGIQQIAYYHPGVGTMGSPLARNRFDKLWTKVCGLAFGQGFRDNVLDAYRYLMENYNDNGGHGNQDEVYIVGFSRGAYTARALAGLLHGYGLLCRGNEGHLPYAWRMYVDQHDIRGRREAVPDDAFRLTFSHRDFKIRFLGLWDTVSSVGWIYTPLRLFNIAKNDTVEVARHAISIDERRCFYTDNLWGHPARETDLLQVWFAGVHSDIGGSYRQDAAGLSDITLKWMLDEARNAGNLRRQPGMPVPANPNLDPNLLQYNPDRVQLVLGKPALASPYASLEYKTPKRRELHNQLKLWAGLPWWILECLPHIYYDKDYGAYHDHSPHQEAEDHAELRRIPFGAYRQILDGSLIHGTAVDRLEAPATTLHPPVKYDPKNLRKGSLKHSGKTDLEGIPYFVFREPEAALRAKKKKPNSLRLVLQSSWVMVPLATLELAILLSIILLPLAWILHFALAGLWCLLLHVKFVVAIGHWLLKYPGAWRWCNGL